MRKYSVRRLLKILTVEFQDLKNRIQTVEVYHKRKPVPFPAIKAIWGKKKYSYTHYTQY
jgi:hypothetical protein